MIVTKNVTNFISASILEKRLRQPKKLVDAPQITSLKAEDASWRTIARKMGGSVGTVPQRVKTLRKPNVSFILAEIELANRNRS